MIEPDTVKLLRECDAGIAMGTASIADVLPHVRSTSLRQTLSRCRQEHDALGREVDALLNRYHDRGKAPNPMAKGMAHMKSVLTLGMDETDASVASLMTDGGNMGIKSLNRYLNQYKAADEQSKDIAKRLIRLEEKLTIDMRSYL